MGVTSANTLKLNIQNLKLCSKIVNKASLHPEIISVRRQSAHLDGSDGKGNLPSAIDVRVENTKDMLELLGDDQRLKNKTDNKLDNGRAFFFLKGEILCKLGNPHRIRLMHKLSTAHARSLQLSINWWHQLQLRL